MCGGGSTGGGVGVFPPPLIDVTLKLVELTAVEPGFEQMMGPVAAPAGTTAWT